VQYRALLDAAAQPASAPPIPANGNGQMHTVSTPLFDEEASLALPAPSLDEVLASFRTPAVTSAEDISWPEEPAQPTQPIQAVQPTPVQLGQPVSAFDSSVEQEQHTQVAPPSAPANGNALDT